MKTTKKENALLLHQMRKGRIIANFVGNSLIASTLQLENLHISRRPIPRLSLAKLKTFPALPKVFPEISSTHPPSIQFA